MTQPTAAGDVLMASGGDCLERMQRLLQPPPPLPVGIRMLTACAALGVLLTPLAIALIDRSVAWAPAFVLHP